MKFECRQVGMGIQNLFVFCFFLFIAIIYDVLIIYPFLPIVIYGSLRNILISQQITYCNNRFLVRSSGDRFFLGNYSIDIMISEVDLKNKVNSIYEGNPYRTRRAKGVGFIRIDFDSNTNVYLACDYEKLIELLNQSSSKNV